MKKLWMTVTACLALATGLAFAADLSLNDVPEAAREAMKKLAGGARTTEVERENEHGVACYEAEWKVNGREVEAKVMANGDLLEMEQEVSASEVPQKVKAAAGKVFPAGADVEYERITVVMYEVEGKVDGKEREILIFPTGVIHSQMDDEDEDEGDDEDDDEDDDDDDDDDN